MKTKKTDPVRDSFLALSFLTNFREMVSLEVAYIGAQRNYRSWLDGISDPRLIEEQGRLNRLLTAVNEAEAIVMEWAEEHDE